MNVEIVGGPCDGAEVEVDADALWYRMALSKPLHELPLPDAEGSVAPYLEGHVIEMPIIPAMDGTDRYIAPWPRGAS